MNIMNGVVWKGLVRTIDGEVLMKTSKYGRRKREEFVISVENGDVTFEESSSWYLMARRSKHFSEIQKFVKKGI